MFADAFDIGGFETGRVILAAGGAGKAIDFFKSFFVKPGQFFQYRILISALQKIPELFQVFFCSDICMNRHFAKERRVSRTKELIG
jgi:hypothetical protein